MPDSTKINIDLTGVFTQLDQFDKRLAQIEQGYKDVEDAAKKAAKSFAPEGDEAVKSVKEIQKLTNEYKTLKNSADTLRTALKTAYDPRAIERYSKELKNAEVGLKKLEQTGAAVGLNLKKIGKEGSLAANIVSEAFGALTKATIILAIIDQVAKLTKEAISLSNSFDKAQKSFTAFTGNADKAAKLVNDLTGVANRNILDPEQVFKAGQSLLAFGESAEKLPATLERVALIGRATGKDFNELALIYGKARTAGVLYAEDINQLVEAGIPIIQEFAKQLGVSTGQVKKLASDGKISFEELQLAFFNLSKEGSQFSKLAAEQATTLPNLYQQTVNKLKPILLGLGDFLSNVLKSSLLQFNIFLDNITGVASERRAQQVANQVTDIAFGTKLANDTSKKSLLFIKQKSQEQIELEKAAADKRRELAGQNAAKLAKEQEALEKKLIELRIAAMRDGEAKEIAQETAKFNTLNSELKKYHILSIDAEKEFQDNVIKIKVKYALERISADAEAFKDQLVRTKKIRDDAEKAEEQFDKEQFDKKKARVDDQIAFDQALFKETELQQRRIFFSKKRTQEEIKQFEEQAAKQREIFQLEIQARELKRSLDFGVDLSDVEKAGLQKRIQNINEQIAQIQEGIGETKEGGKPKTILELLGIKPGSEEEQALQDVVGRVTDAINQITEARIEAANQERQIADDNVRKAQDALDAELELQKQGFANNVDQRQQDLQNAKDFQKKAIEEQKKAARQRALIDAATQVSAIATAAASYFSATAPIPFVGIALAIGAIATMLATISKVKASARSIQTPEFGDGGSGFIQDNGFVTGRSHSDGGNLINIEKGEIFQVGQSGGKKKFSVVRKERVKEYFDLLDAANRGDNEALARHAMDLSGVEVDRKAVSRRVFDSPKSANTDSTNTKLLERVDKIYKEMTKKKETYSPDGKIRIRGNVRSKMK
jgi:tape measure domain-containing protein